MLSSTSSTNNPSTFLYLTSFGLTCSNSTFHPLFFANSCNALPYDLSVTFNTNTSLCTKSPFHIEAAVCEETTLKFLSSLRNFQISATELGIQYHPQATLSIEPRVANLFKYSFALGSIFSIARTLTRLPLYFFNFE